MVHVWISNLLRIQGLLMVILYLGNKMWLQSPMQTITIRLGEWLLVNFYGQNKFGSWSLDVPIRWTCSNNQGALYIASNTILNEKTKQRESFIEKKSSPRKLPLSLLILIISLRYPNKVSYGSLNFRSIVTSLVNIICMLQHEGKCWKAFPIWRI